MAIVYKSAESNIEEMSFIVMPTIKLNNCVSLAYYLHNFNEISS